MRAIIESQSLSLYFLYAQAFSSPAEISYFLSAMILRMEGNTMKESSARLLLAFRYTIFQWLVCSFSSLFLFSRTTDNCFFAFSEQIVVFNRNLSYDPRKFGMSPTR